MDKQFIKLLMIEDDPEEVDLIRHMLSKQKNFSFELESMDRMSLSLERLAKGDIDLVFLDLNILDSTGIGTFEKLHAQVPQIPVVILTGGYNDEQLALNAIQKGAQDYMEKDRVNTDILSRAIPYAIERKRMAEEILQSHKNLEQRVRDRTEELNQTNRVLQTEIEERKQAEKALSEKEQWFRGLIENSADIISLLNPEGIITYASPSTTPILGYSVEEFVGQNIFHFVHAEDFEPTMKRFQEVLQRPGNFVTAELRFRHKSGTWLWLEGSANNLLTDENINAVVVNCRDITERKRLEALKDELIGNVSHELRTPLAIIRESVSQISSGLLGEISEKQKFNLVKTLQNADRLAHIISSLLEVSKIQEGKIELARETVDLVDLVKELVSDFTPHAAKKGLEVTSSFSHAKIEVNVDVEKIREVFNNLMWNALKFTSKGSIKIEVVQNEKQIECSIIDSGIGIAEENFPKLFTKFEQIGRQDGPGEKGTGLGLYISKKIIELHHGQLKVESQVGKGSRFTFILPR